MLCIVSPFVLLPMFLPIPCVRPPSYSPNEFVWIHLVFPQRSAPSGPTEMQRGAQSQFTCPATGIPSHSVHLPTFLLTKQVRLNSFSVSSTFWALWTLTNSTLCIVSPFVLLPIFLPIPSVCPRSCSLNEFAWTRLVFPQFSEPSGPLQTQRRAQSHSHSPSAHLISHLVCPPILPPTKRVRLNSFSVSSTFWTLWTVANATQRHFSHPPWPSY